MQSFNLHAEESRAGIFSLRFSPCGQHIIGGSNNSLIYVVDRETHAVRMINTQRTHKDDINAVSFISDQDSNIFVSGCNDGVLKLWDLRCAGSTVRGRSGSGSSYNNNRNNFTSVKHMPVGVFKGHLDGITYIDPRNDGHYLLTNSKDQSIKIWDMRMTSPNNKLNKVILPLIPWDYRWDTVPRECEFAVYITLNEYGCKRECIFRLQSKSNVGGRCKRDDLSWSSCYQEFITSQILPSSTNWAALHIHWLWYRQNYQ